ncbi:MAG: indolepyruvate oxidoreductase subunit beta [Gammaproteobacteria bacterium]|nr:indolepyruvate oxidoreductase subunit beta [Gammaproteobacteria bacterium]
MVDKVTNILVVGIGGQGVMTASEVIAQTALRAGYDVKKTEVAGMAQRGGVVTSHVRFGKRVLSPAIPAGEADLIVAFEPAEALRWCGELRPGGVAMVNSEPQAPPVVSLGLYDYPADPIGEIRSRGIQVQRLAATEIARGLGNFRLVNTVMLGAISHYLEFSAEVMREVILERFRERKPKLVALNEAAFAAGRERGMAS